MTHHASSLPHRCLLAILVAVAAAACTPDSTGGGGPMPDAGGGKAQCNGNQTCDPGETPQSCPSDCPTCGDGTCGAGETQQSCPKDCGVAPVCGNAMCEAGEATSCPQDCTATLLIENTSSYTIYDLYAKRCTDSAWLPNQLGSYVISPNTQFTLSTIPPDCWDFKATSGSLYWQPAGVDMLAGHTYTWTLTN